MWLRTFTDHLKGVKGLTLSHETQKGYQLQYSYQVVVLLCIYVAFFELQLECILKQS